MFCIAGVCSSGVLSRGVVGGSAFERATPSSRTAGGELSGLHIQRSLVAALSRDDGKVADLINKQHEYGRIIEIAGREIGVVEEGCQNCGARVAGYLNYVGIETPAPWCAAWVSWVFGQARYTQPKTAWSPALFPKERVVEIALLKQVQHRHLPGDDTDLEQSGKLRNTAGSEQASQGLVMGIRPELKRSRALRSTAGSIQDAEGLVMGIYFPELKRIAHCGIVAGLKGNYVQTIEGNTNGTGGREGVGVFRKLRHKRSIAKYADWIRPVPP